MLFKRRESVKGEIYSHRARLLYVDGYFFGPSPHLTQNTLSIIQNSNCELLKVYGGLCVEYVSVLSCFHQNRNAS